jgi:ketosteroid isomerase-like protein
MSLEDERAPFHHALLAWAAGDLEHVLSLLAEDVVYIVNVDGTKVPYASSAFGREDVRQRLQLLLDTFVVDAYGIESVVHGPDYSRAVVVGHYTHKRTGARIQLRFRLHGWVENGLLMRVEELHDTAYVEAFEQLVHHLQMQISSQSTD